MNFITKNKAIISLVLTLIALGYGVYRGNMTADDALERANDAVRQLEAPAQDAPQSAPSTEP